LEGLLHQESDSGAGSKSNKTTRLIAVAFWLRSIELELESHRRNGILSSEPNAADYNRFFHLYSGQKNVRLLIMTDKDVAHIYFEIRSMVVDCFYRKPISFVYTAAIQADAVKLPSIMSQSASLDLNRRYKNSRRELKIAHVQRFGV
jgi:hypothetical protein